MARFPGTHKDGKYGECTHHYSAFFAAKECVEEGRGPLHIEREAEFFSNGDPHAHQPLSVLARNYSKEHIAYAKGHEFGIPLE